MEELHICQVCWSIATPKPVQKGSPLVEILLWGLFVVPGILYSAWRKGKVCPECSSFDVVPMDSVMGKKLLGEIYSNRNTRFVHRVLNYQPNEFMRSGHLHHEKQLKASEH